MTLQELIDYCTTNLVRNGSTRVAADSIRQAILKTIQFFATKIADIIPDWSSGLTFKTDGTSGGKYCKYADNTGRIRLFETKVDNNTNHLPPNDPSITENTYWKEVSASASAALPEWAAGVYGPGLVIVYFEHSEDGKGLYLLTAATRPFSSTNIEAEIIANNWVRIGEPDTRLIVADASGGTITLNMRSLPSRRFKASANITANKIWALSNAVNAVVIPLLRFSTNAGVEHTFPAAFKMFNPLWDSSTKKWIPLDTGEYEARANYDGTTWHLTIEGPYY